MMKAQSGLPLRLEDASLTMLLSAEPWPEVVSWCYGEEPATILQEEDCKKELTWKSPPGMWQSSEKLSNGNKQL